MTKYKFDKYPIYVSKYNSNSEKKSNLIFEWFQTEKDGIILVVYILRERGKNENK